MLAVMDSVPESFSNKFGDLCLGDEGPALGFHTGRLLGVGFGV